MFASRVRKSSQKEIDLVSNSELIEDLDVKLHRSSLESLRIYVLGDSISSKFGISQPEDYFLLDNLYVNEAGFGDANRLAQLIKNDFLDLVKVSQNYDVKLHNQRDFVSFFMI